MTLGESLTISVLSVVDAAARTTSAVERRIAGERLAFAGDVGHEMFSSTRRDLVARGEPLADVSVVVDARTRRRFR